MGATQAATDGAQAVFRQEGDALVAVLSGDWNLERPVPHFAPLLTAALGTGATAQPKPRLLRVEVTALGSWDSSLLIFLRQMEEGCAAQKIECDTSGVPPRAARLLALARLVPNRVAESETPRVSAVARLGQAAIDGWNDIHSAIAFLGDVAIRGAHLLRGDVRMRWREFWVVVQSNSSGALPIVTLIALLVGVIIAFLGVVVLKRFGAGYYVSYLAGYGMLREMGALMTGIIIAGRTGAGFAAEIGSMKITEEIDALSTLGISPIEHLVLPRVLGLFVMMPLLVIYADFVGIVGGLAVAVTMLDLTAAQFMHGMLEAVELSDTMLGVFKAAIFGLIVGVAGCRQGLRAGNDAGAVGRAATSAVVIGITLIILSNAVIDWLAALLQI